MSYYKLHNQYIRKLQTKGIKTMKQSSYLLLLIILVCTLNCHLNDPDEPYAEREWNIMVYQAADNNLDDFILHDLQEMVASGYDRAKIRVIILWDGRFSDSLSGKWGDTRLYVLDYSHRSLATMEIESVELGLSLSGNEELDMGDPDILKKFVRFVRATYPAKRNALIMASHGSGWLIKDSLNQSYALTPSSLNPGFILPSIVEDYTSNYSVLNIGDIKTALQDNHMDILGFDACNMANIEVAYELRDVSDFIIFSQDLEPAEGWDYTGFLDSFSLGEFSIHRFITSAIDSYHNFYQNTGWDYTLAAIDCAKVKNFSEIDIPAFVTYLRAMNRSELINIMQASKYFAHPINDINISYYLDLDTFINNLNLTDDNLETALLTSLADLTVYKQNSANNAPVGSINIFLPFVTSCFNNGDPVITNTYLLDALADYPQTDFGKIDSGWRSMLDYLYTLYTP
jgi:hypothetical protein